MYSAHALALLVLGCVTPLAAHAQKKPADKSTPGDEMIYKYLCAETDKLSGKFIDGAKTIEEWQKKRPRLYQEYMDMLGLWPIPEKTPLKATITGTHKHEGVVIDNLHFQSKPGLYVTANLYRPASNDIKSGDRRTLKKLPTIVYVCGHSNKGRDGNKSAFQDHGMWFASNGYNCLVLDSHQLGEIPGVHHGTYGRPWLHRKPYEAHGTKLPEDKVEPRWWWHAAGFTPAGVEAWNGVRAIDYLVSRPDVDAEKIGVTGISGGGAATFWIACADERVKVAVPVSGMADLESYVKNKIVNGHCDCMFLYNTYQWEWTTIAALVAPRPLLFANSDADPIFPMDANRRIIDRLRGLYKMYGKSELVDEYVSKGGHAYRPDLRVAVFKFINKHLKGDAQAAVKDADFKPIDGKLLRVFPTDADIPKDALNAKIDETFVPRAKVELPKDGQFAEWKKQIMHSLQQKTLRTIADVPAAKMTFAKGIVNELEPKAGRKVVAFLIGKKNGFLILDRAPKRDEIGREAVGLLPLTLMTPWTKESPPNYVERSHVLLGRTVASDALGDVVSSIRFFARDKELSGVPFAIEGRGQAGILAAYAALFEPSIKEVVIIDPPVSHKEGPYFLNVLRVCDIPEALGLLAPHVKLTLIGAKDPAFDRTAAIYKAAGAADKFVRK